MKKRPRRRDCVGGVFYSFTPDGSGNRRRRERLQKRRQTRRQTRRRRPGQSLRRSGASASERRQGPENAASERPRASGLPPRLDTKKTPEPSGFRSFTQTRNNRALTSGGETAGFDQREPRRIRAEPALWAQPFRWRILDRIRLFLRPSLRRPLPVFFVPTIISNELINVPQSETYII